MYSVQCPSCSGQVSNERETCPHCGQSLLEKDANGIAYKDLPPLRARNESNESSYVYLIVFLLVCVLIMVYVLKI